MPRKRKTSDDIENAASSTPERARTPNLRFRRPTLYPIELQAQQPCRLYRLAANLSTAEAANIHKTAPTPAPDASKDVGILIPSSFI